MNDMIYSRVRVFWLSGLVYRKYNYMYAQNILCYGFMYRTSCYNPFYSQTRMSIWWDYHRRHNYLNNYPLTESPTGYYQGPENFQTTELTGAAPTTKKNPPRTGRLITFLYAQYWSPGFILQNIFKTKNSPHRLLKSTW